MKCFKCGLETKCNFCNGLGSFICKTCDGIGSVKKILPIQNPIKPLIKCFACGGTGYYKDFLSNSPFDNKKLTSCTTCKGTGLIEKLEVIPNLPEFEKCFACYGTGRIDCFSCKGKGITSCLC